MGTDNLSGIKNCGVYRIDPNKGRKFSPEHRARMSVAQTGKKLTLEHRAKLRAAKIGKKLSPEHCASLSAAQTLRWARVREAAAAAL